METVGAEGESDSVINLDLSSDATKQESQAKLFERIVALRREEKKRVYEKGYKVLKFNGANWGINKFRIVREDEAIDPDEAGIFAHARRNNFASKHISEIDLLYLD